MIVRLFFFTYLWSLLAAPAMCATLYIDQAGLGGTCSDARDRASAQSLITPLCSLERVNAIAQDGDILLFRAGRYMPPASAARIVISRNDLTLRPYNNEVVSIDFANAAQFNKGITLTGARITLENLEITNAWQECIIVYGANARILRNHIHHCGLQLDEANFYQNCIGSGGTNLLLDGNRIHDSGSHVLYLTGDGITLRNNLIYRSIAPAGRGSPIVKIGTDNTAASNVSIIHNVIGESANRSGIYLTAPNSTITTATVNNNIIYGNKGSYGWGIYVDNAATQFLGTIQIRNNIFAANDAGNRVEFTGAQNPPAFTVTSNLTFATISLVGLKNPGAYDFYPLLTSAAIDAGLASSVTTDLNGQSRPVGQAPDIGAYEYVAPNADTVAPHSPGNLQLSP